MAVCVSGNPAYVPVKVRVYVPGLPLTVVTVTVVLAVRPAGTVTEVGDTVHVYVAGTPLHTNDTLPVKPLSDDTFTVYVVVCPPLMVRELGEAVMEKLPTEWLTPADELLL